VGAARSRAAGGGRAHHGRAASFVGVGLACVARCRVTLLRITELGCAVFVSCSRVGCPAGSSSGFPRSACCGSDLGHTRTGPGRGRRSDMGFARGRLAAAVGARARLGRPLRAAPPGHASSSSIAGRGTRVPAGLGSRPRLGRSRRSAGAISGLHTDRSVMESARGTFLGCDRRGVSPAPGCRSASEHRRLGSRAGRAPAAGHRRALLGGTRRPLHFPAARERRVG